MNISRRQFFNATCLAGSGIWGFGVLYGSMNSGLARWRLGCEGFGDLVHDPAGRLDLPAGFEYKVISAAGQTMSDGFIVPKLHDGMGAFPGPQGTTLLIRNHEIDIDSGEANTGAFGRGNRLLRSLPDQAVYDRGHSEYPGFGAVTTMVYDTAARRLVEQHLSLAGTVLNCSGGRTPWGTWISCEETTQRAEHTYERDHGYAFEVSPFGGLSPAVPLKAMGRFRREAVAVHRRTGIVYQTEDARDGLLYRFLPNVPGDLKSGGRLQALAIRDQPGLNTSNWRGVHRVYANARYWGVGHTLTGVFDDVPVGLPLATQWVGLENVDAPENDLRFQGRSKGAAQFCRAEGICTGEDGVYIACKTGGKAEKGQIWRYVPSPFEGTMEEEQSPATIELFCEPNAAAVMDMPDNLTMSPWGDLFACEDGPGGNSLIAIQPSGRIYTFARNRMNLSEFSGVTFSPDGSTLFVNIYEPGMTFAITGSWQRRSAQT